jgi:hypothetical protein
MDIIGRIDNAIIVVVSGQRSGEYRHDIRGPYRHAVSASDQGGKRMNVARRQRG